MARNKNMDQKAKRTQRIQCTEVLVLITMGRYNTITASDLQVCQVSLLLESL